MSLSPQSPLSRRFSGRESVRANTAFDLARFDEFCRGRTCPCPSGAGKTHRSLAGGAGDIGVVQGRKLHPDVLFIIENRKNRTPRLQISVSTWHRNIGHRLAAVGVYALRSDHPISPGGPPERLSVVS